MHVRPRGSARYRVHLKGSVINYGSLQQIKYKNDGYKKMKMYNMVFTTSLFFFNLTRLYVPYEDVNPIKIAKLKTVMIY